MRTPLFNRIFGAAFGVALLVGLSPADAFDQSTLSTAGPIEAFHFGAQAYRSGNKEAALRALEMAASQGHTAAQWKIARMYADGDGVETDSARAFHLFEQIASDHAEDNPRGLYSSVVANAFVSLGGYYLDGIEGVVEPDTKQAERLFFHAATYFGDAEAQFQLGRIYLDGTIVDRQPKRAARWFDLAASEGHGKAQLLLGQLLWTGDGLRRRPVPGLTWLLIVCDNAGPVERTVTQPVCDKAVSEATEKQYKRARDRAAEWRAKRARELAENPQS